jgi:hypothetical protein
MKKIKKSRKTQKSDFFQKKLPKRIKSEKKLPDKLRIEKIFFYGKPKKNLG